MPHWEWLVPVLLLIFWIVSSLLQGLEKERARANRQRSLPGGDRPPGERPTRRPPSDIDRFLDEVNRRRRQAAERRPASGDREKPPVPAVGRAAVMPRPRPSTRPASEPLAVPAKRIPSPPGKIPQVIPVTPVTAAAEILAVASALQEAPAQTPPSTGPGPAVTPVTAIVESVATELPLFVELLRTPDNLRTAIILHEVFGRPRARRHAGGGVWRW
jgi:hypothetical protein